MPRGERPLEQAEHHQARLAVLHGRGPARPLRMEASGGHADIYIYDVIGWPFISADEFVRELAGLQVQSITAHINSPGGDIFDGIAIYNALRDHPATVEARVDGIAASIASVIAMAGDRVLMNRASTLMIHDGWGFTVGNAADHRKQADVLDQLSDTIAGVYADRTRGDADEWRGRMLAETWYTAQQARDAGLADEVVSAAAAPANSFDLSVFRNAPEHLRAPVRAVTKREAEQALRDAGLPVVAAKAVLAGGWNELEDDARDARALHELAAFIRHTVTEGSLA